MNVYECEIVRPWRQSVILACKAQRVEAEDIFEAAEILKEKCIWLKQEKNQCINIKFLFKIDYV